MHFNVAAASCDLVFDNFTQHSAIVLVRADHSDDRIENLLELRKVVEIALWEVWRCHTLGLTELQQRLSPDCSKQVQVQLCFREQFQGVANPVARHITAARAVMITDSCLKGGTEVVLKPRIPARVNCRR